MIIGKSLTALVSGGLKPEINVTAKAGALLNLHTKNSSIILQSYQLGASETTHTFVVNVSETPYVIDDATNNKRIEVLVDSVEQYRVSVIYSTAMYLYDNGNSHDDITGGLATKLSNSNRQSVTFESSFIRVNETNIKYIWICPNNLIDVTYYSNAKIEFYVDSTTPYSGRYYNNVLLSVGSVQLGDNTTQNGISFSVAGETHTLSVDISSLTGNQYVVTRVIGMGVIHIYKIWLD